MRSATPVALLLALCALATLLSAGCDSGGSEPPPLSSCSGPPAVPLVPLAVGNSWTYESTYYQIPTAHTDTLSARITDRIEVHHKDQNYQAAVWAWLDPATDSTLFPQWLYANGPCGQYMMGGIYEADTFTTRFVQQKYPAEVGMEYDVPRLVYHRYQRQFLFADTLEHRVDSTQAELATPAGTFASYVYHHKRRPAPDVEAFWNYYTYYAPGVGMVGQVVRKDDGDLVSRRMLIEYDVSHSPENTEVMR